MKATAPEKIYVHVRVNKELGTTWHGKKIANSDIEYIRKDTFIEKAIKYIANHFLAPGMDNEIKDFRTYMEGE